MSLAEILAAIPHRPPFLFLDEVVSRQANGVVCRKTFAPEEPYFRGHYPDFPLVPGVLLCEACMQAGAFFLATTQQELTGFPVATRASDVKFKKMIRPGDTVEIAVTLNERLADAFFFTGKVTHQSQLACRLDFACTLTSQGLG
jgi:3-hydroxyacyl-[acyl-carrier-protein] dehydratase